MAWIFPDFQFLWIAEMTKKNLPLELDFAHEGRNCERVAHMFKDFDYIKVRLVSDNVLNMNESVEFYC